MVIDSILALKNDVNLRLRNQLSESRMKIDQLEDVLKQRSLDQVDLTSDMARQYKNMQSELIKKLNDVETKNRLLEIQIGNG
jgi:hypothetical protein